MNKPSAQALDRSIRFLCAQTQGRCFLQWLLGQCDVRGPVFTGSDRSVHEREAQRELGRKVEHMVSSVFGRGKIVEIEEERHEG